MVAQPCSGKYDIIIADSHPEETSVANVQLTLQRDLIIKGKRSKKLPETARCSTIIEVDQSVRRNKMFPMFGGVIREDVLVISVALSLCNFPTFSYFY